jgi:hypothetical protein
MSARDEDPPCITMHASIELGRMITSARTSLSYQQSSRMILIAAYYRKNEREAPRASGCKVEYSKSNKKFSVSAAALKRLKEISYGSVAFVSGVPVGGVVLDTRSEDEGSMRSGRDCDSGITARNGGDALVDFAGQ